MGGGDHALGSYCVTSPSSMSFGSTAGHWAPLTLSAPLDRKDRQQPEYDTAACSADRIAVPARNAHADACCTLQGIRWSIP